MDRWTRPIQKRGAASTNQSVKASGFPPTSTGNLRPNKFGFLSKGARINPCLTIKFTLSRAQVTTLYLISFNLIKTRFGFLFSLDFSRLSVVILDQWCSLYLFFSNFSFWCRLSIWNLLFWGEISAFKLIGTVFLPFLRLFFLLNVRGAGKVYA